MPLSSSVLRIAVPVPLYSMFDYLAPPTSMPLVPGVRVRVPFGKREAVGVLIEVTDHSDLPRNRLKQASAVLDAEPVLPPSLLKLLIWAATYYHHPLGEVMGTALPGLLREGRPATVPGLPVWQVTEAGRALDLATLGRAPAQRRLLTALRDVEWLTEDDLTALSERWRPAMLALSERGYATTHDVEDRAGFTAGEPDAPAYALTAAQRAALSEIDKAHTFATFLLHGVTGSGKTEVYLEAIRHVIARGQQALVLVPEIGLTPQLLERFRRRFGVPIAVMHSALGEKERLSAWLAARSGRAPIVIGTRSAVFVPLANPGLIVVDEEHDGSYKQQEGFRYHARDLAVMRASRENVPIVLGSATPSLETLRHAREGTYTLLTLPERTGAAGLPTVRLLDVHRLKLDEGLSHPLREAIALRLERREQVLLFLNRRGFAPVWMCYECEWAATCARCDARMTFHKRSHRLRCHHCGADQAVVEKCPSCKTELHALGEGTERIETVLAKYFPHASIERIDRDSTRRKGVLEEKLERVRAGQAQILVGTQMLSKGHDFPNVTLVGVLNADQGLYNVDFRAPERLFQQIMQVSGRAGRADKPGEVIIQTRHPEHAVFGAIARHDFNGFADFGLRERSETSYPPYSHLALLRAEATTAGLALAFLSQAQAAGHGLGAEGVDIMDPAPAPMERRAGRYRAQLLIQSTQRKALHGFLDRWVTELIALRPARRVRWSLDVDPMEMY